MPKILASNNDRQAATRTIFSGLCVTRIEQQQQHPSASPISACLRPPRQPQSREQDTLRTSTIFNSHSQARLPSHTRLHQHRALYPVVGAIMAVRRTSASHRVGQTQRNDRRPRSQHVSQNSIDTKGQEISQAAHHRLCQLLSQQHIRQQASPAHAPAC